MITVKFQGGLGNQMFQYAFYKALEKKDLRVCADIFGCLAHNGFELRRVFDLDIKFIGRFEKFSNSSQFFINRVFRKIGFDVCIKRHYLEDLNFLKPYSGFNEIADLEKYTYLDGFWQSYKYFKEIESELKNDFKFKGALNQENSAMIKKIAENNSVSIHVRRGDFLNIKSFCEAMNDKYYDNAIEFIKRKLDDPVFFVFSDDINWCKKNLLLGKCEVEYVDHNKGKDSSWDMYLMSNCRHNIIANSTFSWWGAYLNSNSEKIVIAPRNFGYRIDIPGKWIRM